MEMVQKFGITKLQAPFFCGQKMFRPLDDNPTLGYLFHRQSDRDNGLNGDDVHPMVLQNVPRDGLRPNLQRTSFFYLSQILWNRPLFRQRLYGERIGVRIVVKKATVSR